MRLSKVYINHLMEDRFSFSITIPFYHHVELLERLDNIASEVAITYESGAITIKTDGESMVVEE